MSGYMPAQALLKTLILTNANFPAGTVMEGDYRPLDSGITNLCVLVPGAFAYNTAGMVREQSWDCLADVFTRFTSDASYKDFGTLRDSLIATIDAAPCLSETYFIVSIASDGDPQDVRDDTGAGPFFVMQRLRIAIQENV